MKKSRQIDLESAPGHIRARTRFFEKKKAVDEEGDRARAIDGRFIRVNGSGFRAISLNDCGSLYDKGKLLGATTDFAKARHYCSVGESKEIKTPERNRKPELSLQGWLIKKALVMPDDFASLLCLDDRFDELRFVADEFNLVGVRADVIALGRKGDVWYPVFIEIKVRRALTELVGQLDDIRRLVAGPLQQCFHSYLEAASGIPVTSIRDGPIGVLVWPAATGVESKNVAEARNNGIVTISYEGAYKFRRDEDAN